MRATPAVLFDVDGTLIDTVDLHAESWKKAFEHFGVQAEFADIRKQIGKGADQLMPVFMTHAQLGQFGAKLEEYRSIHFRRECLPEAKPFPGVRALVQELLRRGVRVALASSSKADELRVYEERIGIADLVSAETSKDDAQRSKPHPDIFAAALAKAGGDKQHAVAVGDTPWDALAARKLGVRSVGVLCGGFPESELLGAGCTAIFRDPADLRERLDEWIPR